MVVRAFDDKLSDTLVVVSGEGFWTGSSTLPHLHHFFPVPGGGDDGGGGGGKGDCDGGCESCLLVRERTSSGACRTNRGRERRAV
jgi:hypothetical protein